MAILFVTHDLGVVADIGDRITVLYAGQTVEVESVDELYVRPRHPYSEALMESMPQVATPGQPLTSSPARFPRPGEFPAGCRFRPAAPIGQRRDVGVELARWGTRITRCLRDRRIDLEGLDLDGREDLCCAGEEPRPPNGASLDVKDLAVRLSRSLRGPAQDDRACPSRRRCDFTIAQGETLGLVGESGSGKSTLAPGWSSG